MFVDEHIVYTRICAYTNLLCDVVSCVCIRAILFVDEHIVYTRICAYTNLLFDVTGSGQKTL